MYENPWCGSEKIPFSDFCCLKMVSFLLKQISIYALIDKLIFIYAAVKFIQ